MERGEAEAIYDQGREAVVVVLLRMDEQIQQLTKQVAKSIITHLVRKGYQIGKK